MDTFYEIRKDEGEMIVRRRAQYTFPLHFHTELEVVIVRSGRVTVTVNGEKRVATAGSLIVIDSYDVHGYEREQEFGDDCVVVIPYRYLSDWNRSRKDFRVEEALMKDAGLVDELLGLVDGYFGEENGERVREAAIKLFLARLAQAVRFTEKKEKNERVLVRKILFYLQEHYREDLSLGTVARELGYSPEHISRVFHHYVNKGMAEYVNGLRLDYIENAKRNGDGRKIAELIFDAGFQSQQTYYRCAAKRR